MESIDIAIDGDLTLVVGHKLELRVSACTLRTTSTVFRAMLGPNFAEGQSLRNNIPNSPASQPPKLQLPDDDIEGMKLLCAALHLRNDILPKYTEAPRLVAFATMVDKYACTAAVEHTATHLIEAPPEESDGEEPGVREDVELIVLAAYLLDHARLFAALTENISANIGANAMDALRASWESQQLGGLLEIIQANQQKAVAVLRETISGLATEVSSFYSSRYDHYSTSYYGDSCSAHRQAVQQCHMALVRAGLWTLQEKGLQLEDMINGIEKLQVPPKPRSDCVSSPCTSAEVISRFEERVKGLKEQLHTPYTGVCLD